MAMEHKEGSMTSISWFLAKPAFRRLWVEYKCSPRDNIAIFITGLSACNLKQFEGIDHLDRLLRLYWLIPLR
jgi:hypothetical protein